MLRGGCSLAQPPTGTLSLAQDLSLLGSPWSSFQYEADLHSRLRRAHQQHTWRETHRQVGSPLWWGLADVGHSVWRGQNHVADGQRLPKDGHALIPRPYEYVTSRGNTARR